MSAIVVPLPTNRDDGAITRDQQLEHLIDLYERLQSAMLNNQRVPNRIRIVLSIDDVFELGRLIEQALGPDAFEDDED